MHLFALCFPNKTISHTERKSENRCQFCCQRRDWEEKLEKSLGSSVVWEAVTVTTLTTTTEVFDNDIGFLGQHAI